MNSQVRAGRTTPTTHIQHPTLLGTIPPPPPPRPPTPGSLPTEPRKSSPKGWPRAATDELWAWMARLRPPLPVLVAGAEGGVGASTVSALLAETIAAASPGATVVVDQCGLGSGALARRLVGQQAGLSAAKAVEARELCVPILRILGAAPRSSAGAFLVDDHRGTTSLRAMHDLAAMTCGAAVVDAGRVDGTTIPRLRETRSVLVLVGRADLVGAEAVCRAMQYLQQRRSPVPPVVVLAATAPADRYQLRAAAKLIGAAGVQAVVRLPYDSGLRSGAPLRLDRVSRPTATACLSAVLRVGTYHEGYSHGH
ncbi:hypothetical protein [Actinokineospora sp. NPDC004072]